MRMPALAVCVACVLLTADPAPPRRPPRMIRRCRISRRWPTASRIRWQGRHHYLYDNEYQSDWATVGSAPSARAGCAQRAGTAAAVGRIDGGAALPALRLREELFRRTLAVARAAPQRRPGASARTPTAQDHHRQREIAHAGLGRMKLSDQTEDPERREKRQQTIIRVFIASLHFRRMIVFGYSSGSGPAGKARAATPR